MGQRIAVIIHEPSHQIVMDEIEEITELFDTGTPISRMTDGVFDTLIPAGTDDGWGVLDRSYPSV